MPKLSDTVAGPGFAPKAWQATAPAEAFVRGVPVGSSEDLSRVLALPRRPVLDLGSPRAAALVEMMTERFGLGERRCACAQIDPKIAAGKRQCIKRLLPLQAWALYEIGIVNGLIGSIPVGFGKTAIGCLATLALPDCQTALLLIPPTLMDQLILDYQLIAQHFRVPAIEVHGTGPSQFSHKVPGAPVLHVLSYARLSNPKMSDWIERNLQPQVILADECDGLLLGTARTSRVMRFFQSRPNTRFCGWTGSLTDSKIADFSHLAALALRYGSPLPLDPDVVDDWGRAVDAVENPAPPGQLLRMCEPGEHVRDGFRRRIAETIGVITTTGTASVTVADTDREVQLVVEERQAPSIPSIVQEALDKVRNFCRPDTMAGSMYDEELVDALGQAKCAHEVACGMFYRWIFPRGEPTSLIEAWYKARKDWNCELRYKLTNRDEHLDSPHLCELAAQRHWGDRQKRPDRPDWHSKHWPAWRDIKDQVQPKPDAVRLHPYLAEDAAQWALENHGIVWYGMVEFGTWVAQLSGLTMHGGGPKAGQKILGESGERSIIASIKSHGRGRDGLQSLYAQQLVANTPSSSKQWEQLLGRLHRRGQASSEVATLVYTHTPELRKSLDQALRRAEYVNGVLGATQKLTMGWRDD